MRYEPTLCRMKTDLEVFVSRVIAMSLWHRLSSLWWPDKYSGLTGWKACATKT